MHSSGDTLPHPDPVSPRPVKATGGSLKPGHDRHPLPSECTRVSENRRIEQLGRDIRRASSHVLDTRCVRQTLKPVTKLRDQVVLFHGVRPCWQGDLEKPTSLSLSSHCEQREQLHSGETPPIPREFLEHIEGFYRARKYNHIITIIT